MCIILFTATRNLEEYDYSGTYRTTLTFPIIIYIVIFLVLFVPIINIIVFLISFIQLIIQISSGSVLGQKDGLFIAEGKKNWMYSIIMFLAKRY